MTEQTNEELSETIPLEIDLESADHVTRELLRKYPPYTGPKDSEPTVEENAVFIIQRLARRLCEQGERIEGCLVLERQDGTTGYEVTLVFPEKEGMPESWRYGDPGPITLILNPQEPESDE